MTQSIWALSPSSAMLTAAFFASSELNDRQSYTLDGMESKGFASDTVTSVAIPYGYAVILYQDIGFSSEAITLEGPFYCT